MLKSKLMNLLINALHVEYDPQNTHMLLGGLLLCVQDSALYESAEHITQPVNEVPSNLLSSGKFRFFNSCTLVFFAISKNHYLN